MASDWLAFSKVSFHYSGQPVFENLDFALPDNYPILGVVGKSGIGKSTLLNLVAGFLGPDSGQISIHGVPVTGPGAERPMVFQDHNLFPWMSVEKNICFGLKASGVSQSDRRQAIQPLLAETGLVDVAEKFPAQLSGGMQQRVGLARALAITPKCLLLDEPFAALDELTSAAVQTMYRDLMARHSMNAIHVTHNLTEAVTFSDAILVLRAGREPSLVFSDDKTPEKIDHQVEKLRHILEG